MLLHGSSGDVWNTSLGFVFRTGICQSFPDSCFLSHSSATSALIKVYS